MKEKMKAMKSAVKDKVCGKLKGECKNAMAAKTCKKMAGMSASVAVILAICGCQQLIPATRSNHTSYDDLVRIEAGGHVDSISITIGDGTLASADGGGDSQSNTPTQTISPQTQLSYGIGTGGGSTWGDFFGSMATLFGYKGAAAASTATPAATATPATATADCVGGNCATPK